MSASDRSRGRPPATPLPSAAAATLLLLLTAGSASSEPFVPSRDGEVLITLEAVDPAVDGELRDLRARLTEDPHDLGTALRFAAGYAELGRRRGDPRYDGYAEAALAPWWDLAEPPLPVRLLRAVLAQRRHHFDQALDDLGRVLELAPDHPQALLTRATVLAVRGESVAASRDCRKLAGLVDPLIEAACLAVVARSGGGADAAYRGLGLTLERHPPADPRLLVWTETLRGELARQQEDHDAAEAHFRGALAVDGDDGYLLGVYADLLLDRGRPAEVLTLLAGRERSDPLLLRLAIAGDRLGHPDRGRHVRMLADRFGAARRRGDVVHRREEARFHLELRGEPERALELALANVTVQREPADVDLVVAAALAAGRPEAALATLRSFERSPLIDEAIAALGEDV